MELRNLRKVLLFIRNFFYKQHKKIVNILVKKVINCSAKRTHFFFARHSVNLTLFMESL